MAKSPVKQIHIKLIDVPEVRVTAVYDPELTEQLHDSLEAGGQLIPILVVATGGRFELVDGLHRMDDAKGRGETMIEAKVLEGDSTAAMLWNLATNNLRGKTKASELVHVIGELTGKHGLDSDQIRDRIGMTRDYIEKLQAISEADPEVLDALDRGLIGVGVAFEITRLPDPIQQQAMMAATMTFKFTVKDAAKYVSEVLDMMVAPPPKPPQQPPAPPPPPPTCEVCKDPSDAGLLVAVTLDPKCYGRLDYLVREARALEVAATPATDGVTP